MLATTTDTREVAEQITYRLLGDALTWQRPPGWRHWAEVVWGNPRVPEYIGDMPHTWIGAEFATAVRRMLLREDGDTLELFRAVPDAAAAAPAPLRAQAVFRKTGGELRSAPAETVMQPATAAAPSAN